MTGGARVLIVDDQPRSRQSLRALLATWPPVDAIQESTNGRDALSLIRESPPDIVLLDIRLPELDSLTAARRIKANWPQVKILVLSVNPDQREPALAAGADAFVCKCEPPARLLAALEQIVDAPSMTCGTPGPQ